MKKGTAIKKHSNQKYRMLSNRSPRILICIFILSLIGFLFTLVHFGKINKNVVTDTKNMIGKRLSDFTGNDLSGNSFSTQTYRNKIIVLCYVDKLECSACEKALQFLKSMYIEFQDFEQVAFIAIINETNRYNALRFKKLQQLPYQIILDKSETIRKTLSVNISPFRMIVANDIILFVQDYSANTNEDKLKFKEVLKNLTS